MYVAWSCVGSLLDECPVVYRPTQPEPGRPSTTTVSSKIYSSKIASGADAFVIYADARHFYVWAYILYAPNSLIRGKKNNNKTQTSIINLASV